MLVSPLLADEACSVEAEGLSSIEHEHVSRRSANNHRECFTAETFLSVVEVQGDCGSLWVLRRRHLSPVQTAHLDYDMLAVERP